MTTKTRFLLSLCAATLLTLPALPAQQEPNASEAIHAVTHIDLMPDHLQQIAVLKDYVAHEQHDPHLLRVELLQQISAPNHFTLVETFPSRAAYDAHTEDPYTRRFRFQLDPALGSPFDERLFQTPR